MVAERARETATLPLLFEPEQPGWNDRANCGWTRTRRVRNKVEHGLFRRHRDDEYGARVQHAIVRYVLGNVRRGEVARYLGVTDRTAQGHLSGTAWTPYGRPVLRALNRLGISGGRGDWKEKRTRQAEIIAAQGRLLDRAADALKGFPPTPDEIESLLADIRLLTVALDDQP